MASFSVNARRLIDRPNAIFYHITRHDYEGTFLKELVAWHELEPKADDCTRVIICQLYFIFNDIIILILFRFMFGI
jgi:hypothetical protein